MSIGFKLVAPRFVPPLDPDFRPAALANRAFRKEVAEGIRRVAGSESLRDIYAEEA